MPKMYKMDLTSEVAVDHCELLGDLVPPKLCFHQLTAFRAHCLQRRRIERCGVAQSVGEAIDARIDPPAAAALLEHRPWRASRRQNRQAVPKSLADNHTETFRMRREHEEIGVEQAGLLRLAIEWTEKRNDAVEARGGDRCFYLGAMPRLVGSRDLQTPAAWRSEAAASA